MLYLSNDDVKSVLGMAETVDALRRGYDDLARGDATYVPRVDLYAPTGGDETYYRWGSMTGYCRSTGVVACRIKSDVVSWPGGRTEEKYCVQPGMYSGVILLYSSTNGEPLAIVQDGYLQHMRVGGSAGLGADVLARPDASSIGILGSGGMAHSYLEAISHVRPLREGKVYSPNRAHRERFADEMGDALGMRLVAVDSPDDAVREVDIVASATNAMEPTFDAARVRPGTHVTCVSRRELSPRLLERADVVVQLGVATIPTDANVPGLEWPRGGIAAWVAGQPEERARIPQGRAEERGTYAQLVDVLCGRAPGRTSGEQVSLFVNTGTQGLQFAAVAGRTLTLARRAGIGQQLPTQMFMQDIRD